MGGDPVAAARHKVKAKPQWRLRAVVFSGSGQLSFFKKLSFLDYCIATQGKKSKRPGRWK